MIELMALGLLMLWFGFSYFIFKYLCKSIKSLRWLSFDKNRIKSSIVFFMIFYLIPFWPHILLHFYQLATMPLVCQKMAGYHPYTPVKLTSIYDNSNALKYLMLKDIEFTEAVINKSTRHEYTRYFKDGIYQFRYFPENSRECSDLHEFYPNIDEHIDSWRRGYAKWNVPLHSMDGLCMGVVNVDEVNADYELQYQIPTQSIDSGFGYDVTNDYQQLTNRHTGELISRFQEISTSSPTPLASFMTGRAFLRKRCGPEYVEQFSKNDLKTISSQSTELISVNVILKYYFDFESMESE